MRSHAASWWQQAMHNRPVALVLAMAVCVPLIAAPMATTHPVVAVAAYFGFAVAMLAMMMWRGNLNWSRETLKTFLTTGANLPVLLFLGIVVVSCLLSPHKAFGLQEILRVGSGALLYFTVAYQFRRSEYLSKLVDTLLFLGIASSLIGFAQFAAGGGDYAAGVFGDHQLFGSFLMILLPILAVTAITETKPARQLAAQLATVLTVACLLVTHTRSAWIGAAAGLLTLAILSIVFGARRARLHARKHEVVLPVMLLAVSAGFFLLVWPQSGSIVGRATTLTNVSDEVGWQYRQQMWQGSVKMIKERPLTGFGAGLYPFYEQAYTNSGLSLSCIAGDRPSCPDCSVNAAAAPMGGGGVEAASHRSPVGPTLGEQAHSLYLQTMAEIGIPGLLSLVAILLTFLIAAYRRASAMDHGTRRSLLIGAIASVVAYAVDAFGSPSWQMGQVSMFFWLIMGLGASCMRPQAKHEEAPEIRPASRALRPAFVLACFGLLAILPVIAFACPEPGYGEVIAITVDPVKKIFPNVTPIPFHVYATFRNHTGKVEVTCCPGTHLTVTPNISGLKAIQSGCNNTTVRFDEAHKTNGWKLSFSYTFSGRTRTFVEDVSTQ